MSFIVNFHNRHFSSIRQFKKCHTIKHIGEKTKNLFRRSRFCIICPSAMTLSELISFLHLTFFTPCFFLQAFISFSFTSWIVFPTTSFWRTWKGKMLFAFSRVFRVLISSSSSPSSFLLLLLIHLLLFISFSYFLILSSFLSPLGRHTIWFFPLLFDVCVLVIILFPSYIFLWNVLSRIIVITLEVLFFPSLTSKLYA